MHAAKIIGALSLAVVVLFGFFLIRQSKSSFIQTSEKTELVFYCAAGIKKPVDKIVKQYEKEFDVSIRINYGGSGTLLSNLQVSNKGDLYLAADRSYLDIASDKDLVQETLPVAHLKPVIIVPQGNPENIEGLEDLSRENIKVALANPDAASIGKQTKKLLSEAGKWKELKQHVTENGVFKPTVNEVANDVKIGTVDAGIVWDAVAAQYPELESVSVPVFDQNQFQITIGVLKSSKTPTEALRFARYLTARDKGLPIFAEMGYDPVEGDKWALNPQINLMSGSMFRPAVHDLIKNFKEREGVVINEVYNGCGILVSQMRAGERPDAYFSCDVSFMDDVQELFYPGVTLTQNPMVILVEKGNPQNITSLEDLTREGLKVGLGHPEKSALGKLTEILLKKQNLYEKIHNKGNVAVQSATGDFLVNQIRTGSLDATIVYKSNAALVLDHLDEVAIDVPEAMAAQPFAVAKSSDHRYLMERLIEKIQSQSGRDRFKSLGFLWLENDG